MKREKKGKSKVFRLYIFGWGFAELFSRFHPPLNLAQLAWQKLRWYICFITVAHIVSLKPVCQCLFSFLSFLVLCICCYSSWKSSAASAEELDVILLREQQWDFFWMGLTLFQFRWPRENDNRQGFFPPHHFSNPVCGHKSIYLEKKIKRGISTAKSN